MPDSHSFCRETIHKLRLENAQLRAKLRRYETTKSSLDLRFLNTIAFAFAKSNITPEVDRKIATYLIDVETHVQKLRVLAASTSTLRKLEKAGWAFTLATQYYAPEVKQRKPGESAVADGPKVVLFLERNEEREVFFGSDFEECCQAAAGLLQKDKGK